MDVYKKTVELYQMEGQTVDPELKVENRGSSTSCLTAIICFSPSASPSASLQIIFFLLLHVRTASANMRHIIYMSLKIQCYQVSDWNL